MNIFNKNRCNMCKYSDEKVASSKGKNDKLYYNRNIVEEKTTIYEIDDICMKNKNNRQ